jgi:hypothetical protein
MGPTIPRTPQLAANHFQSSTTGRARGWLGPEGGRWLANGSADGLVEIEIDPPCHTERCLSTLFLHPKVNELIVSLVDPDSFITALERCCAH